MSNSRLMHACVVMPITHHSIVEQSMLLNMNINSYLDDGPYTSWQTQQMPRMWSKDSNYYRSCLYANIQTQTSHVS